MNPHTTRATWRTSSRSSNGGQCVEVGAVWRKSSRSSNGGDCVEVADLGERVAVRDSKDQTGPVLVFDPADWTAFMAAAREGTYDLT